LHIVTSHLDLAKIYTLVEQMLKMDGVSRETPNFDVPNAMGVTPLMIAVQKGQAEVVSYLLEVNYI
jgi:ankyrin repeat protein